MREYDFGMTTKFEDEMLEFTREYLRNPNEELKGMWNEATILGSEIKQAIYDYACKKICDKTYRESELQSEISKLKLKIEELEHIINTPIIIEDYIKRGEDVLDPKYLDNWKEVVPIRVSDLYNGTECGQCLDLVKMLNNGDDFKDVYKVLSNQGHSGMSYSLIMSMVREFSDRGAEFAEWGKHKT